MDRLVGWRDFIHCTPSMFGGKPAVRGTRLSAEFILRLYAAGWSNEQLLDSYPTLTSGALSAIFAYAAHLVAARRLKEMQ